MVDKSNNTSYEEELTQHIRVNKINSEGEVTDTDIEIVNEHQVVVYINERPALTISCLAAEMELLIIGRLITEGYILDKSEISRIWICESKRRVRVFLNKDIIWKNNILNEPTCCADNKSYGDFDAASLAAFKDKKQPQSNDVFKLAQALKDGYGIHKKTNGTHMCYLMHNGEIISVFEDISRHNALDKTVGYMASKELSPEECIVFTTGRVPCDMIRKVIRARIPIVVSKAVPTMQAVEMAAEYNLTLVCKAWPDSYEIFC